MRCMGCGWAPHSMEELEAATEERREEHHMDDHVVVNIQVWEICPRCGQADLIEVRTTKRSYSTC